MPSRLLEAYAKWRELYIAGSSLVDKRVEALRGDYDKIYAVGVGGSGSAGAFLSALARWGEVEALIISHRSLGLPGPVDERTLVLALSYSGRTLETLHSVERALRLGARVIGVTSGGPLLELLEKRGLPVVRLPGGLLPRASLPLMLSASLRALEAVGVRVSPELSGADEALADVVSAEEESRELAEVIGSSTPVLLSCDPYEVVATRLREELAENSKRLSLLETLPNAGHNAVVAWARASKRDYKFIGIVGHRATECEALVESFAEAVGSEPALWRLRGRSLLEEMLRGAWIAGLTSIKLAEAAGVDPVETPEINAYRRALDQREGLRKRRTA
ncbi:MAG: SIS domain-containing protein [Fervidicoccaceae archaeon]